MSSAFISSLRYWFVLLTVTLVFSGLMGRLVYLQAIKHDEYSSIAQKNRKSSLTLSARRGNILDCRGNPLAITQPRIELGADPQLIEDEDNPKILELAKLLNLPPEGLLEKTQRKTRMNGDKSGRKIIRWVKLAESIDEETYQQVKELNIPGVYGNRKYTRTYPGANLGSHLLGFLQKDGTAVTGVEKYMDYYLRGQDGWRETERDGRRRELLQFESQNVSPEDGLGVQLTLDLFIQNLVEDKLRAIAEEYDPTSATIIVSEPNTGYILALSNYPDFDPNHAGKSEMDHLRNRAITDIMEPGSTFKLVPISAALNEKILTPENTFNCGVGSVSYRGRTLKLPSDHRNYGELSLSEILVKSSNRGSAFIGIHVGENALYEYAKAFGFGQKTGIGLLGEVGGILHPVKKWDGLTITRLPIGYAVSATPMQIHNSMATIANYGILMQPQVIYRIMKKDGEPMLTFRPKAKRRVISVDTARKMGEIMMGVVTPQGTARKASIDGFMVAGKTGTTRKLLNGVYTGDSHTASFTGFFPSPRPRVVISVFVDEPKLDGPGYGGRVAAPVFRDIAKELIKYMGIRPEKNQDKLASSTGKSSGRSFSRKW